MNILPFEKQIEIVAALCEGVSIRAAERLTGVHRDTIMRLGARVGKGAALVHDRMMKGMNVARIELDEAWSFVGKKQRKLKPEDSTDLGDQYVFIAMASSAKAILSFHIGKRDLPNTRAFLHDLRARVVNAPEISSDGFQAYPQAIDDAFGIECTYGQIVKKYVGEPSIDAARRYSPGYVVGVEKSNVVGKPVHISTSYVERQNLTVRMHSRRFTRLTNGFSKKLENHVAAFGLHAAYYNFCRVHESLRVTPAMALNVADHIWTIGELLDACLDGEIKEPVGRKVGRFTVIDGGVS